jgi:glycosyltransferase involved in cell wall biosynthesis
MACALPVVSTRVGGVEYLLSKKEGWLVPSNDVESLSKTLIKAYVEKEQSVKKGENGRLLAIERYSIGVMVKRYMEIYGCGIS